MDGSVSLPAIGPSSGGVKQQQYVYSNSRASTIPKKSTAATPSPPATAAGGASRHGGGNAEDPIVEGPPSYQQQQWAGPRSPLAGPNSGISNRSVFDRLAKPTPTMQRALEAAGLYYPPPSSPSAAKRMGADEDERKAHSARGLPSSASPAFQPLPFSGTSPQPGPPSTARRELFSTAGGGRAGRHVPFDAATGGGAAPSLRSTFTSGMVGMGAGVSMGSGPTTASAGAGKRGNSSNAAPTRKQPPPSSIAVPTSMLDGLKGSGQPQRSISTAPSGAPRPPPGGVGPLSAAAMGSIASPMTSIGPSRGIPTAAAPSIPAAKPITDTQMEGGSASTLRNKRASGSGGSMGADPFARGRQGSRTSSSGGKDTTMFAAVPSPFTPAPVDSPHTNSPVKSPRIPQNKFFQNYHAMLIATKAENEAARLEGRGLSKNGTLEGVLNQERALWVRCNYAVLNKGVLPISNSLPSATVSATSSYHASAVQYAQSLPRVPNGPRMSIVEAAPAGPPAEAHTAQWEKSEVLIVLCNQMLVRHLQSLSDDHIALANDLAAVCERVLWAPQQLLLCNGPAVAESSATAPQLLALGPLPASDPFTGHYQLRTYLLGCTLCNYAAVQRLSREPLESIVATLERALQIQELSFSCQTLFNLSAVLVESHRFSEALEAATLCIELANHHLSSPFMERERHSPAYDAFITETATLCVLAHHLVAAVASWSGSLEVATYHAQLGLGCSTTFLGLAHALTTRSAQRLEAISQQTAAAVETAKRNAPDDQLPPKRPVPLAIAAAAPKGSVGAYDPAAGADELNPPLIPLQMAVFGSNVRPSAILSYATCYPLSPHLERRLHELRGLGPDGHLGGPSSALRAPKALFPKGKSNARAVFAKHFTNVLMERKTGLPAISMASIADPTSPAYRAMMRAQQMQEGQRLRALGMAVANDNGGLRFIPPSVPGTILMPPLTPKYRSITNSAAGPANSNQSPTRSGGSGGRTLTSNRFLVAPVERSQFNTPIATRAPSPNTAATAAASSQLLSIGAPNSPPSSSSASKPAAGEATPVPSSSSDALSGLLGGGTGGYSPAPSPRFQSTRPKSPTIDDGASPVRGPRRVSMAVTADDGSLLPGFTLEKPRGSIILPDRHVLVPQPPAPRTAKCVSVIPLRDYEMYQALQADVEDYLAPQYAHNGRGAMRHSPSNRAAWLRGSIVGTTAPRSHSHALLKKSDEELRELSQVVPDHTLSDEVRWDKAARVLQDFYKVILAKNEMVRRQRAVAQWRDYAVCGEAISNAFRSYKERKPAVAEKHARQGHANRVAAATMVQSMLRAWQAAEETAGRVLAQREEERVAAARARLERMAAVVIQSVYRGHVARADVAHRNAAARTIQRWMRYFKAYQHMRLLVFSKRRHVREVLAVHTKHAKVVQRWWRHKLLGILAVRELAARKERMRLFMEDYHAKDLEYWALFKDVDEEKCVALIGRIGRAYVDRRDFGRWGAKFVKETKAAKILQRFVRYGIAKNIQNNRRAERKARLSAQRREEEQRIAAIDIQCAARRFLAKLRCDRIRADNALRLRSVIIIQNLFRRAIRRRTIHALLDADRWDKMLYLRAEARRHAATAIQSLWRMHRAQQFVAQYHHFKRGVEPHCANVIQRACRCFLARAAYRDRLLEVEGMHRRTQLVELQRSSAVKIQSAWRMHKVASHSAYGRHTHPTYRAAKAAVKIQTLWRAVAAKGYVAQQRLIQQHRNHYYVNLENLHHYATKIQSVVRMAILNQPLVVAARHAKDVWAVRRLQRVGRRFMRRRAEHIVANRDAAAAWEASKVICSVTREALATAAAEDGGATPVGTAPLLVPSPPTSPPRGTAAGATNGGLIGTSLLTGASPRARAVYSTRLSAGLRIVRWAKCCLAVRKVKALRAQRDAALADKVARERAKAAGTMQRWWREHLAEDILADDYDPRKGRQQPQGQGAKEEEL